MIFGDLPQLLFFYRSNCPYSLPGALVTILFAGAPVTMVVEATRRVPPSGKVATPARWVFATSIFCNFVFHYWRLSNNYFANMEYSIGCWASTKDANIMDHGLQIQKIVVTSCFSVREDSGSVHKKPVLVSVLLGGKVITGDPCSIAFCHLLPEQDLRSENVRLPRQLWIRACPW